MILVVTKSDCRMQVASRELKERSDGIPEELTGKLYRPYLFPHVDVKSSMTGALAIAM